MILIHNIETLYFCIFTLLLKHIILYKAHSVLLHTYTLQIQEQPVVVVPIPVVVVVYLF